MDVSTGFSIKNSNSSCSILSTLNQSRKFGEWCDLKLEIRASSDDSANSSILQVHACIVAAASVTLAPIVSQKLPHILLENLDPRLFTACVDFIYGQDVFVTYDDASDMLQCARQFGLREIAEACDAELSKPVPEAKPITVTEISGEHLSLTEIYDVCPLIKETTDKCLSLTNVIHVSESCSGTNATLLSPQKVSNEDLSLADSTNLVPTQTGTRDEFFPETEAKDQVHFEIIKQERSDTWNRKATTFQDKDVIVHVATTDTQDQLVKNEAGDLTDAVNVQDDVRNTINIQGNVCDTNVQDDFNVLPKQSATSGTSVRHQSATSFIKRKYKKRKFSSTGRKLDVKHNKPATKDLSVLDLEKLADQLGVPAEIRPLLEPSTWPSRIKNGCFKNKPRQAYRMYYVTRFKLYKCEDCGEEIRGQTRFDLHRRKEKKQFVYCSYCAKAFTSRGGLLAHELRHRQQKDVQCSQCNASFYFQHELKTHMRQVHGEQGGPVRHLCSQCAKTFSSAQARHVHEMRVHYKKQWKEDEPLHRCQLCSYVGFSPKDVSLHMLKHSTEKPFVCRICRRYASKRIAELRKHMKTKHGVEDPTATKRGRTVAAKQVGNDLKPDEDAEKPVTLLPKQEKVYKCPHCEYTTLRKPNLSAHVVIHSAARPYKCPMCDLGFKRKNVMVRHAERLHKVDLRNEYFEVTDDGKRRRRKIEQRDMFLVETVPTTALTSTLVTADDVGAGDLLGVGADDLQPVAPREAQTVTSDSDEYLRSLHLLDNSYAGTTDNAVVQAVEEVVVDSASRAVDSASRVVDSASLVVDSSLMQPSGQAHAVTIPISDPDGFRAETEIVIDSSVLNSMEIDNIVSQLRIVTE